MLRLLRRLTQLSPAELGELAEAQGTLLWARLIVATRPTGKLVSEAVGAGAGVAESTPIDTPRAQRLARAVNRAAAHGVGRPKCLVRAVALSRMMERRGLMGGRIAVGVRRVESEFQAHAWVEYGGVPLGELDRHVSTFSPLADVNVMRKP